MSRKTRTLDTEGCGTPRLLAPYETQQWYSLPRDLASRRNPEGIQCATRLTADKDKLSIERDREHYIQQAIHPPKQEQKQENPQ
jgi:hypothetical protein